MHLGLLHLFHRVVPGFRHQFTRSLIAENISTAQVDTRRATSLLTESPPLLATNVYDCAKVLSLPSFTGEGGPRGQRHGHGHVRRTSFQYNTRCDADIGENL